MAEPDEDRAWALKKQISFTTGSGAGLYATGVIEAIVAAFRAVRADERAKGEAEAARSSFTGESGIVHRRVVGALRSAIDAHGPVTARWIGAATKRIVGALLAGGGATGSAPALGAGPSGFESQPPDQNPPCSLCGGPYQFDTSIPSVLWNRVVRAQNLPEYLCANCILRVFADAGVSFSAELFGAGLRGTPIAVEINGAESTAVVEINDENNRLRTSLRTVEAARDTAHAAGVREGRAQADDIYGPAMRDVLGERVRQEATWGEQNHDPFCYLTVLVEEVGEFAQAALHARFGGHAEHEMRKEAVHVAAVALAIVELLDRGKWYWGRNDGRPAPPPWKPGEPAALERLAEEKG